MPVPSNSLHLLPGLHMHELHPCSGCALATPALAVLWPAKVLFFLCKHRMCLIKGTECGVLRVCARAQVDVVIVGGGLVGMNVAAELARNGEERGEAWVFPAMCLRTSVSCAHMQLHSTSVRCLWFARRTTLREQAVESKQPRDRGGGALS